MTAHDHERIKILQRWEVCRHRLPSGLRVLLLEDPSTPLISYHTWFRIGSRHEKEGKTGLAHLFEHLMFESTSRHPSGAFDREMERFGAETNASTWLDWTCYHETFPPEALDLVLEFEPDRMVNLVLDEEVVEREKNVVMNERRFRVEDSVDGTMEEVVYWNAFRVHPYRNPTIGHMEDIRNLGVEECRRFYRTYYSPGNATLVVAGSFDHEELVEKIVEGYGNLPAQAIPGEEAQEEPSQEVERMVAISREVSAPKLAVAYHAPPLGHPKNAALSILGVILCGGETGRLVRRLVHEKEIASEVFSWVSNFKFPGLFEFHVDLREGKEPDEVLEILDEEIAKLLAGGISEDEITTTRNRVLLGTYGHLAGISGKAAGLGFHETVLDDCGEITKRLEDLRRATAAEVLEAASGCFNPTNRTVVTVTPHGK